MCAKEKGCVSESTAQPRLGGDFRATRSLESRGPCLTGPSFSPWMPRSTWTTSSPTRMRTRVPTPTWKPQVPAHSLAWGRGDLGWTPDCKATCWPQLPRRGCSAADYPLQVGVLRSLFPRNDNRRLGASCGSDAFGPFGSWIAYTFKVYYSLCCKIIIKLHNLLG